MANPHKVINKTSVLKTLLDDTNRLTPFLLAILDNLESRQSTSIYLRHLVRSYTEGRNPKHLTIFCLEQVDKERFAVQHGIQLNPNVTLISEDDLLENQDVEFDLRNEEFYTKLASFNRSDMDNVLLIDSLVPLFMSQGELSLETTTKNICAWFSKLSQNVFSHIAFVLHTDFVQDHYAELGLTYISNAIIDFRLNAGLTLPSCPLTKLTTDKSVHCLVTVKKKHPRTHFKVSRKHEHFIVDRASGKIIKHQSSDELEKIQANSTKSSIEDRLKNENPPSTVPESTFNMTLKKNEQAAKDELILPYMRKNTNTAINTNGPSGGLGGVVASATLALTTTSSGGQITYHYDQFDDFDEDDPDDDLDF